MKQWLKDAVFYEIYPQSFYDTNGDGIGDLQGIIAKLDYIRDLGCNALWINPCFDSPFKDAGYDVRDYKKIAPRYGTNEDAAALFRAAHEKGIHVLFDLVPGHTSEEHPWFKASCKPGHNEYSDRFIWTDSCFASGDGMPFIGGETERNGTYILNFFKCQPALNYGYGKINQKWQKPTDDPACVATVEAMKDVMRFWLDMGCDGFRVDMASSLVKNDTKNKKYTCKIWRNIRDMLDVEYPEAALIAEWNGPRMSLKNGFDMDFYLNWQGNGYSWLMRNYDGAMDSNPHNIGKAYFCKNSGTGIDKFLDEYLPAYKATHKDGLWCFITCNHDTIRLTSCGWPTRQFSRCPVRPSSTTVTRSVCAICRCPPRRAATSARAPARRCSGTTRPTTASPPPTRRISICLWTLPPMRPLWPPRRTTPTAC